MKLLLKLISVVTICSILLIGSQCHEQNDDNENDFQIEEELIQNEMKPELQVNDNDDKDMSNDDDYDDDAKNNGEDAMELEVEDPVKRDDDATEHDIGQLFGDGEDDSRSFMARRRRRRRVYIQRRVSNNRRRRDETMRRRRRWWWKKDGKARGHSI